MSGQGRAVSSLSSYGVRTGFTQDLSPGGQSFFAGLVVSKCRHVLVGMSALWRASSPV